MPATEVKTSEVKVLSVRIPEPDIRRLKTTAANRGMSVQEAVRQAVESWLIKTQNRTLEPLDALQGSLAGGEDVDALRRREREEELAKDRRWFE